MKTRGVTPPGKPKRPWPLPAVFFGVLLGMSFAAGQTLPTGMTVVPFYDTSKAGLSFRKDKLPTMGMWEVPGKPRHFLVLGYFGYIWSLYPDTTQPDTVTSYGPIKRYTRTEVANFNNMVMKGWEQGASGGGFDPNFRQNRYFYTIYNKYANPAGYRTGITPGAGDGNGASGLVAVDRWILSADFRTLKRDTTLLSMPHGTGFGASNMVFGKDGYLYISTSAYSQNSWDSTTFMRKILRIDLSRQDPGKLYAVPPANPWYGAANPNVKKEVFAYGVRNSYSIAADYLTGSIWAAEVGQSAWEEVNLIQSGRNYGWAEGGDKEPSTHGVGLEGPCPASYSYNGPISFGKTMNCNSLTNGTWNFTHSGTATGGVASSSPGTYFNCIILSQAFRGDPASPFYGYHFITDVKENYFLAAKEGVPAIKNVGRLPANIRTNVSDRHDGIVAFSEDAYGNMYAILVSSSSSGATNWHDIYKLSHPELTPLGAPRDQVTPTTALSGRAMPGHPSTGRRGRLLLNAGGTRLDIPAGYSGARLYNPEGKKVWDYKGTGNGIRIPGEVGPGILQILYLP